MSIQSTASTLSITYGQRVALVGVLVDKTGNGLELGKEVKKTFPAIVLDSRVDFVASKEDIDSTTEQEIKTIQLSMPREIYIKYYKKQKGKRARVYCTPFHANNPSHLTPVVCDIDAIERDSNE
ncbi:DUF4431 domain-containing protein [Chromobacterium haemolyticum]|nr:DUF4431 domain-containing protein [Chromobacterium haemolyticum]